MGHGKGGCTGSSRPARKRLPCTLPQLAGDSQLVPNPGHPTTLGPKVRNTEPASCPAQDIDSVGGTQKFLRAKSNRTPIQRPRNNGKKKPVSKQVPPSRPGKPPPTVISQINTAPFTLNEEYMEYLRQMDEQTLKNCNMPAAATSTIEPRQPRSPPPFPERIPKGATLQRLLAEQNDLEAELAAFAAEGYQAHVVENNETPGQTITFFHGESEEVEEICNNLIDENYELRIRLQAVRDIKRNRLTGFWRNTKGGQYEATFCGGINVVVTFP